MAIPVHHCDHCSDRIFPPQCLDIGQIAFLPPVCLDIGEMSPQNVSVDSPQNSNSSLDSKVSKILKLTESELFIV